MHFLNGHLAWTKGLVLGSCIFIHTTQSYTNQTEHIAYLNISLYYPCVCVYSRLFVNTIVVNCLDTHLYK